MAVDQDGASRGAFAEPGLDAVDQGGQGVVGDLAGGLDVALAGVGAFGFQRAKHQGVGPEAQVQPVQPFFLQQADQVGGGDGWSAEARLDGRGPSVDAEGDQPDAPRALAVALELGGQGGGQFGQDEADALHVQQRLGEHPPGAIPRRGAHGGQRLLLQAQGLVQAPHQMQAVLAPEPARQPAARQGIEVANDAEAEPAQQLQRALPKPQGLHRQVGQRLAGAPRRGDARLAEAGQGPGGAGGVGEGEARGDARGLRRASSSARRASSPPNRCAPPVMSRNRPS